MVKICLQCKGHRFNLLSPQDPLEEGIATHSSILAWRIPWTKEPGGLQSLGSQRVRHDWADTLLWIEKQGKTDLKESNLFFQKFPIIKLIKPMFISIIITVFILGFFFLFNELIFGTQWTLSKLFHFIPTSVVYLVWLKIQRHNFVDLDSYFTVTFLTCAYVLGRKVYFQSWNASWNSINGCILYFWIEYFP